MSIKPRKKQLFGRMLFKVRSVYWCKWSYQGDKPGVWTRGSSVAGLPKRGFSIVRQYDSSFSKLNLEPQLPMEMLTNRGED